MQSITNDPFTRAIVFAPINILCTFSHYNIFIYIDPCLVLMTSERHFVLYHLSHLYLIRWNSVVRGVFNRAIFCIFCDKTIRTQIAAIIYSQVYVRTNE